MEHSEQSLPFSCVSVTKTAGFSYSELQLCPLDLAQLDVSKMEEHIYLFRIQGRKTPGILVQLTRALEALDVKILNANLTSVDDHILNTVVVEVNWKHFSF